MGMPIDIYGAQKFEIWQVFVIINLISCLLLMFCALIMDMCREDPWFIYRLPKGLLAVGALGFMWGLTGFPYALITHYVCISAIFTFGGVGAGVVHLIFTLFAFGLFVWSWMPKAIWSNKK